MPFWQHVDGLQKCQAFDYGRETEAILDQIAASGSYIQIKKKNPLVHGSVLESQDFRLTSNILFSRRNCQTCGKKNGCVKQYHSCNCQVCKDKALKKPVKLQCFRLDFWEMFLVCESCLRTQLALSQEFKLKNEFKARMQKERKMKTKSIKKTFKKKKDLLRFIIQLDSELSQYGVQYKQKEQ